MWIQKHKPRDLDGFLGKSAVKQARQWDGSPLIIAGPTGSGKTLLANLVASERGWDLIEVSDENLADADSIANTASLFGSKKLVLIEDADSLKDIKAAGKLVQESANPVILTTSDYSSRRLSTLKRKCAKIQIRRSLPSSIAKYLSNICELEGVKVGKEVLDELAKKCKGDIRAAVTDLETLTAGGGRLEDEAVEDLLVDRDRQSDIYKALSTIYGGRELRKVVSCTWDIGEQPRDVLWWVDENTPRLYKNKESINQAYISLSRADVFMGRIVGRQYWGFLRYANFLMTAGVNQARPSKVNYTQYVFPSFFSAMGRSKAARNMEKSISAKVGPLLHCSQRVVKREYIPLIRHMLEEKAWDRGKTQRLFDLEEEEIDYLSG